MVNLSQERPRPTFEDGLRATAYLAFAVWAVLFLVFPPMAYTDTLDTATRIFWMSACGVGAIWALLGSLFSWDLKGELPGLIIMSIGPLFYFAAQIYYLVHPMPGTDPHARIAISVYALLPLLLILPRMYALYSESRRMKRVNTGRPTLTPEQEAQPGAFRQIWKRGK